jgi:chaperonin cofactor prefoldin
MIILLASVGMYAQSDNTATEELKKELQTVKNELQTLRSETRKLKSEATTLQTQLTTALETIESLKKSLQINSQAIRETADQLGVKITSAETAANQQFQKVGRSVSNTTLYVVIVFLSAVILSILLFWRLNKRQKTDKSAIIEQLGKTKADIEENLVNELGKEVELLDTKLKDRQAAILNVPEVEPDHSLALKVASEINLIERNTRLMKEDTKGLKQLRKSIDTLKDNLAANGYDVPQLLGKEFHEGMKVIVINSVFDESLENDAEIITKVIIPQVNYNGKMIQAAQIEITVGPTDDDDDNNQESNSDN